MSPRDATAPFYGWRMVALAFVAYNVGLTCVVNTFGPALPYLQRDLGASRGAVSMVFGVLMLALGLLAPVVGNLTRWVKLRTLMMAGSALNALGFLLLAFARNLSEVLLIYAGLIGTGTCLIAIISAPSLISRWFERDRGKALGVGLVQVSGLAAAPLAAWTLTLGGRHALFLALAGLFVALTPLMILVIDQPEDVGQTPRRALAADVAAQAPPPAPAPDWTSREIFTDGRFWLLTLVIGVFSGAGVAFSSHGPSMAAAKGASLAMGSLALGACGAGALLGSIGFGWLADRINPFRALIVALALAAMTWLAFSVVTVPPLLVLLGMTLGCSMGASVALHSACVNELFGPANFSRVMGYSYFIKIPFLFAPAPLAGWLYDLSGGYGSTYLLLISALAAATLGAAVLAFDQGRARRPAAGVLPTGEAVP